jgi:tetratricopeptide (TPR) repeat protein
MMDATEEDLEYMEAYLQDKLSPVEKSDFENRLLTEPGFASVFESFRYSYHAILRHSRKELKTRLQSLEPRKQKTIDWKYIGLAIAASVALIMMVVINFTDPSPEALYAEYYTPYPNVVAPIERAQPETDAYKRSFQLYEEGKYPEAFQAFKSLLNSQPGSAPLNFYAGLCALSLNDSQTAIAYLNKVTATKNEFAAHATWYTALAYLHAGEHAASVEELKKIAEDSFYAERVNRLLKALQ